MTNYDCACSSCSPINFHKCSSCGHLTHCSNQSAAYDKTCQKDPRSPAASSYSVSVDEDVVKSAIHSSNLSQRFVVRLSGFPGNRPDQKFNQSNRPDQKFQKINFDPKYTKPKKEGESVNARLKLAQLSADRAIIRDAERKTEVVKQEKPSSPEEGAKPIDKDLYKNKYRTPPSVPRPLSGTSGENSEILAKIQGKSIELNKQNGLDENNMKADREIVTEKLSGLVLNDVGKPAKVEVPSPAPEKKVSLSAEAWKSHVPIKSSKKSQNVFIQVVDVPKDKTAPLKIFITPLEYMTELFDYLESITNFYRQSAYGLKKVDPNTLKVGDLVIYPFDEEYMYRAEVISTKPDVLLRCIDFGNTFKIEEGQEILPALKSEKSKPAYAFEVIVDNPEIFQVLEEEAEARVKIISEDPVTVVLKPKRAEKADKSESKGSDSKSPADNQKLRFINNGPIMNTSILRKDISVGENVQLLVLDVSNLMNYEITVCESNDQNMAFYDNLDKEIKNYWNENKTAAGYLPIIDECVLVELDGLFYRATCLSISKNKKVNLHLIDYGNIEADIDPTNIMKYPAKLLYTSCAVTCEVRGIEKKITSALDEVLGKIDSQILNAQFVEKIKNSGHVQYCITLDFDKLSVD